MRTKSRTVLIHEFASGGGIQDLAAHRSWLAEGSAMRRAAASDFSVLPGVRVVMTLDARLPEEAGAWALLRVEPGDESHAFQQAAASADATLVIAPETGGVLEQRLAWVEQVNGRSLGCTPLAARIAANKWDTHHRLLAAGIDQPPTFLARSPQDWPAFLPGPWVLKPIDGAGSVQTWLVRDSSQIPNDFPWPGIVQTYVQGTPMSASFLVGRDGEPILVGIARQHFDLRDNLFVYRGGSVPSGSAQLAGLATRATRSIAGLMGWVGVDFIQTPGGQTVILEVNPRLTTSYVGFRRLLTEGSLASAWLSLLSDEPFEGESFGEHVLSQPAGSFSADGTAFAPEMRS